MELPVSGSGAQSGPNTVDDGGELRRVIVNEFSAAVEAARDAVSRVDDAPATAVHEYRKALRRARAILDLVSDELPRSERRAMRRAVREARRAVGVARDHVVAPDAVDLLALEAEERETAKAVLQSATEATPEASEVKQALAVGAARAAAQVEVLEAALPESIHWTSVLDGVRTRYRDARRARKAAKRSMRAFHRWRRRSKELAYQLQALAGYSGSATAELCRELQQAADTQGEAVDLIMLRDFLRNHGEVVPRRALKHLVREVDTQLADRIELSRSGARAAFRTKPKKFARKLSEAVRQLS
jgi:CHAD domain-containing protein